MSYDTETARRYREQATKLRTMAADYEASETAEILLGVAKDYESMARSREGTDSKNIATLKA